MHPTVEVKRHLGRAGDPTSTVLTVEVHVPIPEIHPEFHHAVTCDLGAGRLADTTPAEEISAIAGPYMNAAKRIEIVPNPASSRQNEFNELYIKLDGAYPLGNFVFTKNPEQRRRAEVALGQQVSEIIRTIARQTEANPA